MKASNKNMKASNKKFENTDQLNVSMKILKYIFRFSKINISSQK